MIFDAHAERVDKYSGEHGALVVWTVYETFHWTAQSTATTCSVHAALCSLQV